VPLIVGDTGDQNLMASAGNRGHPRCTGLAVWLFQVDDRNHAARRRHGLCVILRYFNVAGADPKYRTGQSSKNATHLIKVAVEAVLGLRSKLEIYAADDPTPTILAFAITSMSAIWSAPFECVALFAGRWSLSDAELRMATISRCVR
jgi:hypothetical protein